MVEVPLQVLNSISTLLRKRCLTQECSFVVKNLGKHRIVILQHRYSLPMNYCVYNT